MHRHRPQPTPGQLSLKLKLPKIRKSRQHQQNWQLTLADLIDRLPQLPLTLDRQLALDLEDRPLEAQLTPHHQWFARAILSLEVEYCKSDSEKPTLRERTEAEGDGRTSWRKINYLPF
jgi:hypothetical protein